MNLVRMFHMLHKDEYGQRSLKLLEAFRLRICEAPIVLPHMVVAAAVYGLPPKQIVIAGSLADHRTQELLSTVQSFYDPHQVVLLADGESHQYLRSQDLDFLKPDDLTIKGAPAAYICDNFTCQMPISDAKALHSQLTGASSSASVQS